MTRSHAQEVSSFWYGAGADERAAASVLQALREYRAAEMEMRRRTRASMGMSDNEMLVVGLATRHARAGRELQPRDLAHELGLTTASVTGLLDKLERSGHIRREPHPTDRRRLRILPTALSDTDVRASLGSIHERMMSAARTLPPADAAIVTAFLRRMSAAIADPSPSAA